MQGNPTVHRIGQPRAWLRDTYALLLELRWRTLHLLLGLAWFLLNAIFALVYYALGNPFTHADPDSLADAFFFSVQTSSTIGYGSMSPMGTAANLVVFFESGITLVAVALVTGLLFARFARPSAGMLFSKHAVVTRRNGVPTLMFRVANARGSDLVEASVKVTVLMDDLSEEGAKMRKLHDLKLVRDHTPLLLMSWLVMHPIDEESPLHGMTPETCMAGDVRIIASLTGIDGTFNQTVFLHHTWLPIELKWDHDFVDVVKRSDQGFELHLHKFHDVVHVDDSLSVLPDVH